MTASIRPAQSTELALLIGGPDSGKSTFLVQLYGRLRHGSSALSLASAPESLGPVSDGLARLSEGLPVRHTSAGVEVAQELTTRRRDGTTLRLSIPDYPGEAVDELVDARHVSPHWCNLIVQSTSWNLFVRIERMASLPGLPEREEAAPASAGRASELPLDIRLVELLQILCHERQRAASANTHPPDLTVVLSRWDEIPDRPEEVAPAAILQQRVPLLHSFVATNWGPSRHQVVGLSAQGRPLAEDKPDSEFIELGPESMGFLVRADGSQTGDLSELLTLTL